MSRLALSRRATLGALLAAACALLSLALAPGARAAGSVSVSFTPSDLVAGAPMTATISGTTDTHTYLFAVATPNATCGAQYIDNSAIGAFDVTPGGGTPVSTGSYSQSFTFTPPSATTYHLCAYLSQSRYLSTEAMGQATFTPRSPHVSGTVAVAPGATEGQPVSATVTGNVEVQRRLYLDVSERACPSQGSPMGSDFSGAKTVTGDFGETFTVGRLDPKTYHFCAYVYDPLDPATSVLLGDTAVAVARFPAGVGIAVDRTPFIGGQQRIATVTGSIGGFASLSVFTTPQSTCAYVPPGSGRDLNPGPFSTTLAVDAPGVGGAVSVCAVLSVGGTVYAADQVTIQRAAVAVPAPVAGAPSGLIADRRPTFSWSTASIYDDTFALTDRKGTIVLLVTSKGVFVPSDDSDAQTVRDASEYLSGEGDSSSSSSSGTPKGYDSLGKAAATYAVAGAIASVRLSDALPPGRYAWTVLRTRTDGDTATGPLTPFKLAGPKLTRLAVKAKAKPAGSSAHPGSTRLRITTTPYAYIRLALRHGGHQRVLNLRWGAAATATIPVDWSCRAAGGSYDYTITASDDDGTTKTKKGTIHTTTKARCRSLKAAEQRAAHQRAAQRRREAAAAQRALQRRIDRCHALSGEALQISWPDGSTSLVCATAVGIFAI
jgi:hypothetical protein